MTKKKPISDDLIRKGLESGQLTHANYKTKKGIKERKSSGYHVLDPFPGPLDHPSRDGVTNSPKDVHLGDKDTVWTDISHEHYAQAGIPKWILGYTTSLGISIYWQYAHYQLYWGKGAWPAFKTISFNLGCTYRSVQRSVHELLDIGALELVRKHSGQSPGVYRVVLLSSLLPPEYVETTKKEIETTNEVRLDDVPVTQKTKPHKGRVARSTADADRAATPKKKTPPRRTIDEERNFQAKQRAKQQRAPRTILFRPFFPVEVRKEKIEEVLEIKSLANKWEAVKELARVSGGVDLETETFIPAPEVADAKLLEAVQLSLTKQRYDVTNLAKALDSELDSWLEVFAHIKRELERQLKNAQDQRERDSRLQAAKEKEEAARREKLEREEAERLLQRRRDHEETFEYLERARELLLAVFPNFSEKIDDWGSVTSLLYELGDGKESARIEILEVRSKLSELSKMIPKKLLELHGVEATRDALASYSTLEKKLECWIEGGEEWGKLRFF